MQWAVEGARADSGQVVTLKLEAGNAQQAEALASRQGLLVSEVRPAGRETPTIAYETPAGRSDEPYRALRLGTAALRIGGLAYFAVAVLNLTYNLLHLMGGVFRWPLSDSLSALYNTTTSALWPLITGAFVFTAGAAGVALRDIAKDRSRR